MFYADYDAFFKVFGDEYLASHILSATTMFQQEDNTT